MRIFSNRRATSRSGVHPASSTSRSTGLPEFPALGRGNPLIAGDMHFLDTLERYERAYDDWKSGTWSKDPYLDLLIPSLTDPMLAAPGKHMMSVFAQYVPVKVHGRDWTDADRDAFRITVFDQIARYSPNFRSLVLHAEVRTPRELEQEVGLTEGNIMQGELTFDQLFFNRPLPRKRRAMSRFSLSRGQRAARSQEARPRPCAATEAIRPALLSFRGHGADGFAHRFRRRSRLRAVDRAVARGAGCGTDSSMRAEITASVRWVRFRSR